jgi:hypothetical protein
LDCLLIISFFLEKKYKKKDLKKKKMAIEIPKFDGVLLTSEEVDWGTTDFASVAVYLSVEVAGEPCLILGKNAKYDNLSAFGGLPEKGETLRETCYREFAEETLRSFAPDWMSRTLTREGSRVWKRPGNRYVCHAHVTGDFLLFIEARARFHRYYERFKDQLTAGESENNDLVALSLKAIKESASENTDPKNWLVAAPDGKTKYKLRDVCVATSLMLANEQKE